MPITDSIYQDILAGVCHRQSTPADGCPVFSVDRSGTWLHVRNGRTRCPEQGWKLHVSAGISSAEVVLRQTLPVLFAADVEFKLAVSPIALAALNDGSGGLGQVGKFITVYPETTRNWSLWPSPCWTRRPGDYAARAFPQTVHCGQAVWSTTATVDRATASCRHHLARCCRAFSWHLPASSYLTGAYQPTILRRGRSTRCSRPASPTICRRLLPLIADRYLVVSTVHRTARGAVHVAVDTATLRRCVLKQANRDAQLTEDGKDARDRLRHEAAALDRSRRHRFRTLFDLLEVEDNLYLVMEHVAERRWTVIWRCSSAGLLPTRSSSSLAARSLLAALVATIHDTGIVHRDLKASNVIVATMADPARRLRSCSGSGVPGSAARSRHSRYMSPRAARRLRRPHNGRHPRRSAPCSSLPRDRFRAVAAVQGSIPIRATSSQPALRPAMTGSSPVPRVPAGADRYTSLVTLEADLAKAGGVASEPTPRSAKNLGDPEADAQVAGADRGAVSAISSSRQQSRLGPTPASARVGDHHLAAGTGLPRYQYRCSWDPANAGGARRGLRRCEASYIPSRKALVGWQASPRPEGQPPVGL